MTQFRILAAAAAIAGLVAASGASAQAAPFTPRLNLAYAMALEYWGGPPTNCTSIDRQIVPARSLPQTATGHAYGQATQATRPTPCFLYIDRRIVRPRAFAWACATMIHEVGHLRGLGHSPDPRSVMSVAWPPIPRCEWAGELSEILTERHLAPRYRHRIAHRFWGPLHASANAARAGACPAVWAIDGGPVGNLPGVTVHAFGHGPVDPDAAAHAKLITGILHRGLPRLRVELLSALPAVSYRARDRQVRAAIDYAAARLARVVNISAGKPIRQPRTCHALRRASETLFVVAGRSGYWPAVCRAPNSLTVGRTGDPADRGADLRVVAPSTSEATARATVRVMRIALRRRGANALKLRALALRRLGSGP
jgi:hypothetical protein